MKVLVKVQDTGRVEPKKNWGREEAIINMKIAIPTASPTILIRECVLCFLRILMADFR